MFDLKRQHDTYESVRDEREYGPYWYSLLWRIIRPVLVIMGSLLVVAGLIAAGWKWVYGEFLAPPGEKGAPAVAFNVEGGQSLTRVANNLEEAGLIRSGTVFKYYCDFAGLGQKIQEGSYQLSPGMTMTEIAAQLSTGDGNPLVRNITLIPGWTLEEFAARLVKDGVLDNADEFLALCRTGEAFSEEFYSVQDALADDDAGKVRYALEGYLSPNTYEVYVNAEPEEIIRKMLAQTEKRYPADREVTVNGRTFTMNEILTLASIIEKEAKESDFARVSAVFHNRLKKGEMLGSDVTIHYITGQREMKLDNDDLAISSPYNTYRVKGLPPGPICAPSEAAIQAALNPDATYLAEGYMYFCAKEPESGELAFAITQQEHDRNVAMYADSWREYDESRGVE